MSDTVTIKLAHPIEFGKTTIEELTFRKGRLGDMKGIRVGEAVPMEGIMAVAGRMCGQPLAVMEKLDEEDAGEVVSIALGFIERCLLGGRTE